MTLTEAKQVENIFGQIFINGSIYHKIIHGYIRDVEKRSARIERLEGDDLIVDIKSITGFKKKKGPDKLNTN